MEEKWLMYQTIFSPLSCRFLLISLWNITEILMGYKTKVFMLYSKISTWNLQGSRQDSFDLTQDDREGFMMADGFSDSCIWESVFKFPKEQQWHLISLNESSVYWIPLANWLLWKNGGSIPTENFYASRYHKSHIRV
jgi:hypothetical protein